MKHMVCTLALGLALLAGSPAEAAAPTVTTSLGPVRGELQGGAKVFWSLPYAAPPVGALRWRPPQPPSAWAEVRDATAPGPICPQAVGPRTEAMAQSEDCLTLNVWTPATAAAKPRPVMVWIHGGNFRSGSGSEARFDGSKIVTQDVVLVTINYRLGMLGRFAHPALSREQAGEPRANYGIMDQIAALRWVKQNIAAFGGDPGNVTIFGYSAGGVSVNYLMGAPSARGLFHKAIAQSGGITIEADRHISTPGIGRLVEPLEPEGVRLAEQFAIPDDTETVIALRKLPAAEIVAWQEKTTIGSMNPVVDGVLIPDDLGRQFREGRQARVPYLAGADSWEDSLIHVPANPFPPMMVLSGVDDLAAARAAYPGLDDAALAKAWFADATFVAAARYLTKAVAASGEPAWLYHFTWVPDAIRAEVPGAPHGMEVPYVFGVPSGRAPVFQADDWRLSATVQSYWVNFARTGNPNGAGLPVWPSYGTTGDVVMDLGERVVPIRDFRRQQMDFHEAYANRLMDQPR